MEGDLVKYKDLKCILVKDNSKKYLMIEEQDALLGNKFEMQLKEYGFLKEDNVWKLEVYNCFNDYQIDEEYNICRGESVGKYILSDLEVIYAFQMEGCGFSSRYWQITYEEYINYKQWENDENFKRKIVDGRPYLGTYFSKNDLFKIVKQWEKEKYKEYYLQYTQESTDIIKVFIKEKEDKSIIFGQISYVNLAEIDIEELNDIFSNTAHLYYNGYISSNEWDRECWSDTLYFSDREKVIAYRELRDSGANHEERLKEERDALKSIILEIDKKDLIDAIDKAIIIAQEHIDNNFNVGFMNTMIKNYKLAKEQLNELGEITDQAIGGSRAYLYNCFGGELSDSENKLLKAMDLVDKQIQRLIDNKQKYNVTSNNGGQYISKDDFLNSHYN